MPLPMITPTLFRSGGLALGKVVNAQMTQKQAETREMSGCLPNSIASESIDLNGMRRNVRKVSR